MSDGVVEEGSKGGRFDTRCQTGSCEGGPGVMLTFGVK